jgi:hypothetical protein
MTEASSVERVLHKIRYQLLGPHVGPTGRSFASWYFSGMLVSS